MILVGKSKHLTVTQSLPGEMVASFSHSPLLLFSYSSFVVLLAGTKELGLLL